jgi:hypothetical protein
MNEVNVSASVDEVMRRTAERIESAFRQAVDIEAGLAAVCAEVAVKDADSVSELIGVTLPSARVGSGARLLGTDSTSPRSWRPAPSRRLRALAGIEESLLDRVPSERVHFTSLGALVLVTSLAAGGSMFIALNLTLNGGAILLIPSVLWAFLVLSLDRTFLSTAALIRRRGSTDVLSSRSTEWYRRILMVLPRVVFSVSIGLLIAQMLLLRAFQAAIDRDLEARQVSSTLIARVDALNDLARRDIVVRWTILLVLLFVLIDCMPVLVRMFAPLTSYDRIVYVERVIAEEMYREGALITQRAARVDAELTLEGVFDRAAIVRDEIESRRRTYAARRRHLFDDATLLLRPTLRPQAAVDLGDDP